MKYLSGAIISTSKEIPDEDIAGFKEMGVVIRSSDFSGAEESGGKNASKKDMLAVIDGFLMSRKETLFIENNEKRLTDAKLQDIVKKRGRRFVRLSRALKHLPKYL